MAGNVATRSIAGVSRGRRPPTQNLEGGVASIATAKRLGLQWVGETSKYYGLNLQVYRIRPADMPA